MTFPTSTYRLQFRNGMTFDAAIDLLPHLARLGISHLYASPVFAATSGSTHGYDVIDPNSMEPALGGMDGFLRLSDALTGAGLGIILDIVPNHLAASLENPWWHSVVELGQQSPYADYFDIDWRQRLTLPVLTDSLENELENGIGLVVADEQAGTFAFDYRGSLYPLHPETYDQAATALDGGPAELAALLDRQPWRLIRWQDAATGLSYRRFFEIAGLVGTRVEEPHVFEAMHKTVLDLVRQGRVDGLRIDHIDGLADPAAYLQRLRHAVGPEVYIVVEKILERDEELPQQWPVQGTTGYEFIASLSAILTENDASALDHGWAAVCTDEASRESGLRRAKEQMVDVNFRGEVSSLQRLLNEIASAEQVIIDAEVLDAALRELLLAFPVYRTYGTPSELPAADATLLAEIFERLAQKTDDRLKHGLNILHSVLTGEVQPENRERATRFRTRMQHLTGPLLAKALEDTFFYRYNRLIALNEVGGDPLAREGSVKRFHRQMQRRAEIASQALTTTTTHDTKRAEDARARLYALSEAPEFWVSGVERWRAAHSRNVSYLADGPAPEPALEWLIYQSLAGAWPVDLDISNQHQLAELQQRFLPYIEKSLREAKQRTNWNERNEHYEKAVATYVEALLSPANQAFLSDFRQTLQPFIAAGLYNSVSQTLLKIVAPGIPDIYQGCELHDFSMVDPDNRRRIDFKTLGELPILPALPAGRQALYDGSLKLNLTAKLLHQRHANADLFERGTYVPLTAEGPRSRHIVAFARVSGASAAIVVAPRLLLRALQDGSLFSADFWSGTSILLPEGLSGVTFTNLADDSRVVFAGTMPVRELLEYHTFCVLMR